MTIWRQWPACPSHRIAVLCTCAYAAAVVADHVSSLEAAKAGAVETNMFFQTSGEALAKGRAILVFLLLLWPVMLGLLWLAHRRARGLAREPGPSARQLIGRRAETTALLPIVVVIAKLFAAAANMVIAWYAFSIYGPIRKALSSAGVTAWNVQSLICAALLLLPAIALGAFLAGLWFKDKAAGTLTGVRRHGRRPRRAA